MMENLCFLKNEASIISCGRCDKEILLSKMIITIQIVEKNSQIEMDEDGEDTVVYT